MNANLTNAAAGLAAALRQLATAAIAQGVPLDVVAGTFAAVATGLALDTAGLLAQAQQSQIAIPNAVQAAAVNGRKI